MAEEIIFSPSDFVVTLNQTLEFAYPGVFIQGELTEFRVSKGRWVYFKLRDADASVQFFGTVQQLQHEFRDGMMLQVRGFPRLHPLYGFSVQVQFVQPVGEGSIKQAADLVMQKLKKEGLFDADRKRPIPYPPRRIGLIASVESAAYRDFIKILGDRWRGIQVEVFDVHVQGEQAVTAVTQAIELCNQRYQNDLDAIVITRGGGSPEDLAAFSTEQVARAVADSALPCVVAIGHERDVSLAELAADVHASTPSNAAELLVPSHQDARRSLKDIQQQTKYALASLLQSQQREVVQYASKLAEAMGLFLRRQREAVVRDRQLLAVLHPDAVLSRGFARIRSVDGSTIRSIDEVTKGDNVSIELHDGSIQTLVQSKRSNKKEKL